MAPCRCRVLGGAVPLSPASRSLSVNGPVSLQGARWRCILVSCLTVSVGEWPRVVAGCWVALFPCLLVDLLGINKIERSLGHCMAFCSVVFLVATPLSGRRQTSKERHHNVHHNYCLTIHCLRLSVLFATTYHQKLIELVPV